MCNDWVSALSWLAVPISMVVFTGCIVAMVWFRDWLDSRGEE